VYKIREDIDINELIDGRTFLYLSQQIKFNRENLAKIIKGYRTCTYDRAKEIVDYCKPNDTVEKYFVKVEKEG
jgi:hypothetical protein